MRRSGSASWASFPAMAGLLALGAASGCLSAAPEGLGQVPRLPVADGTNVLAPANAEEFDRCLSGTRRPVLVYFSTPHCPACRRFDPEFLRLSKNCRRQGRFVFVDLMQVGGLAGRFNIVTLPTLMLFRDRQPVFRLAGVYTEGYLCDVLTGRWTPAGGVGGAQAPRRGRHPRYVHASVSGHHGEVESSPVRP